MNIFEETTLLRKDRILKAKGNVTHTGKVFDIAEVAVPLPSGKEVYEFAVADDVVRVYPIDVDSDTIWLIREMRPAFSDEPVLRPASGSIRDGETIVEGAARELEEELGITANSFKIVHCSQHSLKLLCSAFHVVAEGLTIGEPNPGPHEIIESSPHRLSAISELALGGEILDDGPSVALMKIAKLLDSRST